MEKEINLEKLKKELGIEEIISNIIGKTGLSNCMNYTTIHSPQLMRYDFEYKTEVLEKYGKILYSAYGDEPPASVTQLIKDEYGID
mgnify:CR=1 FL=1